MLTTRFTRLIGCAVPIQQAGMGAAAPPELAAAVSEAGAFGMLGTARSSLNAMTLAGLLERTRQLTTRPFGVNFIMRPGSVAAGSPREFIEQAAKVAKIVSLDGTETAVPRFATRLPDRTATGQVEAMSLYAGESVGDVKRVLPAREVVRELVEQAEQRLRRPR